MKRVERMPLGKAICCSAGIAFVAFIISGVGVSLILGRFVDDTQLQDKIGIPIVAVITALAFFSMLYELRRK
jgi:hypothetical protein